MLPSQQPAARIVVEPNHIQAHIVQAASLRREGAVWQVEVDSQWSVKPTTALKLELEETLNGHGNVELAGDGTRRIKRLQQQRLFQDAEPVEAPVEITSFNPEEGMDT